MSGDHLHVRQRELPPEILRRAAQSAVLVAVMFALVILRLAYLQISWGDYYQSLSENNRVRIARLRPTRGVIVARGGEILVDNQPSFDLVVVPEDAGDLKVTLANLSHYLGGADGELMQKALAAAAGRRPFEGVLLKRGVDWNTVVAVESHRIDLPGINLHVGPRRYYRFGQLAAHLVGHVGEVGPQELARDKSYRMGDLVGRAGIEKTFETFLRGRSGGQQIEVDALGRELRVLTEVHAVAGNTVVLTLDTALQQTAEEALGDRPGAVVVMDVNSGEVLAMASKPVFDPNLFARGISRTEWAKLLDDPIRPLNNRAVQGLYPPGSIFKIVVAAAGLEEKVVSADTEIFCGGRLRIGRRNFRCWRWGGHGWVDMHRALVESCDIFFYEVGRRLGVDKIAEYAHRFGLGAKTGIGLSIEKSGLVPTTSWKEERFGLSWFPGETISVSIGQGYLLVTPLQMAQMIAAVANGGTVYRPQLVKRVETIGGSVIWSAAAERSGNLQVLPGTLEQIRAALRDVVNSPRGTGRQARLEAAEGGETIEVAGKTGTAQASRAGGRRGKQEKWDRALRDHAWFVSFAPWSDPEVAVAVLLEHAGHHGGEVAAPVAREVLAHYFKVYKEKEPRPGLATAGLGH